MASHPTDFTANLPPSLARMIDEVRADREHGASWLARRVAQALADAADDVLLGAASAEQRLLWVEQAARACVHARPSMAAVANTATRIWAAGAQPTDSTADSRGAATRLGHISRAALDLVAQWDTAASAILATALPLLTGDHQRLCTHSRSGTVEAVLLGIAQAQWHSAGGQAITVTESRPGGEGVETARRLAAAGWSVTFVADAAAAQAAAQSTAVVLGADSVRADGSIVNKIGSYALALGAAAAGVPVYVLCETLKVAALDAPLELEAMPATELLPQAIAGVTVRNSYFEQVPAHLIGAIVSERGLLTPATLAELATTSGAALALLDHAEHAH